MASLGHKQGGRVAAVGLATQEERLEEVLPSFIPVLSHFMCWRSRAWLPHLLWEQPGTFPSRC